MTSATMRDKPVDNGGKFQTYSHARIGLQIEAIVYRHVR